MRDSIRRFNDYQRACKINPALLAPVRIFTPKPMTMIPKPVDGARTAERPMTKKQIFKLDRKGVMQDAKDHRTMKDEKMVTYWAYRSVTKSADRMSRVKVKVNLQDILRMRGGK